MVEKTRVVDAATGETVPVPAEPSGKGGKITTTVWCAGKNANREALLKQAVINTRDAIPVAAYDVTCEVTGTKTRQLNKADGTAWEIEVTYTPAAGAKKEAVDLERVIKEAQASYDTHPGDPDFLG